MVTMVLKMKLFTFMNRYNCIHVSIPLATSISEIISTVIAMSLYIITILSISSKKIVFDLMEFGVLDSKIDFFIIRNIIIKDIVIIFSDIYYFGNNRILY